MEIGDLNKLKQKLDKVTDKGKLNEEQTKNYLILPLFVALGYDVFNIDEFVPEYTADFGTKQGEKVDYAICINGQPLILVEAKKLSTTLGKEHISQLFRYFASTDAKIAILTNGEEYWFFTDSERINQMDTEPYFRLNIKSLRDTDVIALSNYSRTYVERLDIASDVQLQRYRRYASNIVDGICSGNLSREFIEWVAEKAGTSHLEKAKMAAIFDELLCSKLRIVRNGTKQAEKEQQDEKRYKRNKDKKSDIVIGKEYIYNEIEWPFHKPDYIVLLGNKYQTASFKDVILKVMEILIKRDSKVGQKLLLEFSDGAFRVYEGKPEDVNIRALFNIEGTELYISTAFGSPEIARFIGKALEVAKVSDDSLKICFAS